MVWLEPVKYVYSQSCNDLPGMNAKVMEFVKTQIGKKTGRGECWDLAAGALDFAGANWDHEFNFGEKVSDPFKDCVYPGDIIQFKGVKTECRQGNSIMKQEMDQHTAVIYEVKDKGNYVIAEQNTSYGGRKVVLTPFELQFIKKGKFFIYHPVK